MPGVINNNWGGGMDCQVSSAVTGGRGGLPGVINNYLGGGQDCQVSSTTTGGRAGLPGVRVKRLEDAGHT